ncbi:cytochrome P450 [Nonomuraea sp. NPDC050556]|uniref:cytochrome P450 n=1 Tax=Nonomuraea sp. NPDC050556 TaxID=3364369 RepID=UPI0037A92568
MKRLPVAPGRRLLGRLHLLHRYLDEWTRAYGPLYRFRLGGKPFVVVADPQRARQILRDRPDGFRRMSAIGDVLGELGLAGLFAAEGDDWRRRRRPVARALNAAPAEEVVAAATDRLRERWARRSPGGDVHADLMRFTAEVMAGVALGRELAARESLAEIFPMLARRINAPFPYWRYVKLPADRRLDRAIAALRAEIGGGPFLEAIPADQAFAEAMTVLVAGQDTTASTLSWLLHHLATHPGAWERARLDPDEVIRESMRLRPVAPFLFLETLRDTDIAEARVPRGTAVIVMTGAAFGGGPRVCPGSALAMLELRSVVAMLLDTFERPVSTVLPGERFTFAVEPVGLRLELTRRR